MSITAAHGGGGLIATAAASYGAAGLRAAGGGAALRQPVAPIWHFISSITITLKATPGGALFPKLGETLLSVFRVTGWAPVGCLWNTHARHEPIHLLASSLARLARHGCAASGHARGDACALNS